MYDAALFVPVLQVTLVVSSLVVCLWVGIRPFNYESAQGIVGIVEGLALNASNADFV